MTSYDFPTPKYRRSGPTCVQLAIETPAEMDPADDDEYRRLIPVLVHNIHHVGFSLEQARRNHEEAIDFLNGWYNIDVLFIAQQVGPSPDSDEPSTTYFY